MKTGFKKMIKDFLPPIVLRQISARHNKKALHFSGNYKTWSEALAHSKGYQSDTILEKVRDAGLKVKRGEAAFERDGVTFAAPNYPWRIVASLLWVATQENNWLRIMDFGGSLGSLYFQNKKLLAHLDVSWGVVEQPSFVEEGKKHFEDRVLRFFDTIETCVEAIHPNCALFSSVLPYLEKPYEIVEKTMSLNFKYILVDRTAFLKEEGDRLTIQTTPSGTKLYEASYPAWFFSEKKFLEFLAPRYELVAVLEAPEGTIEFEGMTATYKGFLLKKRS